MAGRGTDIVLGGNVNSKLHDLGDKASAEERARIREQCSKNEEAVRQAGGLHVLGSERHESRRVDNQLRGRCARQGDPGSSQFFLSLEDHLFRIFPQSIINFIKKSSKSPGECLQAPMLNQAIATNQQKMEAHYYDIRKQILKYDDIANEQRLTLYEQRNELLNMQSIHTHIPAIIRRTVTSLIENLSEGGQVQHDILQQQLDEISGTKIISTAQLQENEDQLENFLTDNLLSYYHRNVAQLPEDALHDCEKQILLQIIDVHWKEHLLLMEDLRESIGLRSYAQRNPEHEYKIESYNLFKDMLNRINSDYISHLLRLRVQVKETTNNAHD